MGNQYWDLGMCLICICLLANTYTCLSAGNITTVACSRQDQKALLKFKYSVDDASGMLSSWVGNDCCRWERVRCNGVSGYVQGLYLRGDHSGSEYDYLVGNEVSTSLGELRHLRYLDLSDNNFQGIQIPEFIGSFKLLRYLNLSHSHFSGNIPPHLGNLSNLEMLDLSSGVSYLRPGLKADDMAWISGLLSIKHLDLSAVKFTGLKNGDKVFHTSPSLVNLSLSECQLSNADLGRFLNSNITLANIKHLNLGYNSFNGQVPRILQNLTSLEFLDLTNFDLSQAWKSSNVLYMIPSLLELHLSNCSLQEVHLSPTHLNYSLISNIQHLDISFNIFQGKFPTVLTNMTSLRVLDLSSNRLNSPVPVMPNLLELDLSGNEFKQLEDVGIWRQCHLKQLTLSVNKFPMELPSTLINISECSQYAFEGLYLYSSVNGRIPESLDRMANLKCLDLGGNQLTGQIPASLRGLRSLEELYLYANQLTGSIPTFPGKLTKLDLSNNYLNGSIPESIGRLASLTDLNLGSNQLTGSIPTSIGGLVFLRYFSVNWNSLNGTLPVSIGQLSKLQSLYVSRNSLGGIVSEAHFANLSMLKKLDISFNSELIFNVSREWMPPFQLIELDISHCKIAEDRFPHWLQSQRKLKVLALSNASIVGTLPTWFGMLPVMGILDLSHNKLSGPLTNLPSANPLFSTYEGVLLLQHNLFNGSIPMSLCKWIDLGVINLSSNRLTGKIPNCLGDLKLLEFMIFSSNKLSGVIPSSFGHKLSLRWLNLNNNSITGKLPRGLVGNSENLEILDLGENELSGSIPESIGEELANLVIFRLHKNNFSGRIPPSVCHMSKIQIFDVAHNNLSGPIPRCLGGLYAMHGTSNGTTLRYLINMDLSSNNLRIIDDQVIQVIKGVALVYTTTLRFVINMDLSSNKLVGEIPMEITALSGLIGLNLSNNHLNGSIPNDIGNMTALISLDLSGNKLTGPIPPSIAALYFLSRLNLSHNNLSGRIPSGNQLQTLRDPSIYAGNEDLCGAPLPKNCSSDEDPTTPPKNNHKTSDWGSRKAWLYGLDIMSGFATGFWGVIGVLVFKKQWRRKFFMFAEATMDKIYITIMVRVFKMKRGTEVAYILSKVFRNEDDDVPVDELG